MVYFLYLRAKGIPGAKAFEHAPDLKSTSVKMVFEEWPGLACGVTPLTL